MITPMLTNTYLPRIVGDKVMMPADQKRLPTQSVLGQTVVSTGAYIVRGGPKAPASRYIWIISFSVRSGVFSRHESDPHCTSRQACRRDR